MSPETLLFLRELLSLVRLGADAQDFDLQAARISRARRELDKAISEIAPVGDDAA